MAHAILENNQGAGDLVVVGILKRGYPVAKRLAFSMTQIEGSTVPCGKLDISGFRDDRAPEDEGETEIPFEVTGKTVILVDEVIFTGRTARAALNALMASILPSTLALPPELLKKIPPRPSGYGRTRELFPRYTGPMFDAISPAVAVLGDWHVQTGMATPDRTARYVGEGAKYELVTTTPLSKMSAVQSKEVSGRKLARYVLVYEAK